MERRQFCVVGLGRFGSAMAVTLAQQGYDVIGIDGSEERVREVADAVTAAVQLDATDAKALRAAGIQDVDVAIVSIGENIEASVLAVMLLKELGIPEVIAKAVSPLHARILERLGVSRVVLPEHEMAVRLAHSLALSNVIAYVELSGDYSIVEIPAPRQFVGRTLKQLELRPRWGLTLIAIKRRPGPGEAHVTNVAPSADEVIQAGDVLALLGDNGRVAQLDKYLGG
jgi:trk system potassium uptake protein TrkA